MRPHLLALVLAAALASAAAPDDGATVVREDAGRADLLVPTRDGRIEVHLDPWANLVLHTASLYELFDGQGRDYALRDDVAARAAVRPDLLAAFGGKDRRYSRHGTVYVVAPAMLAVAKRGGTEWPSTVVLESLAPEPFGRALASTWENFYAQYWRRRLPELLATFRAMQAHVRWAEMLARMEEVTGTRWSGVLHVYAVEASGRGAFTFGEEICAGTLRADGDAGFVHEGLHLLLKERWAKSPRIAALMAEAPFADPMWGRRWASKYEQAVVVLLELHLKGAGPATADARRDFLRRNLAGNGVGDLADFAIPAVDAYLAAPARDFDQLMWDLVSRAEPVRRRAQP